MPPGIELDEPPPPPPRAYKQRICKARLVYLRNIMTTITVSFASLEDVIIKTKLDEYFAKDGMGWTKHSPYTALDTEPYSGYDTVVCRGKRLTPRCPCTVRIYYSPGKATFCAGQPHLHPSHKEMCTIGRGLPPPVKEALKPLVAQSEKWNMMQVLDILTAFPEFKSGLLNTMPTKGLDIKKRLQRYIRHARRKNKRDWWNGRYGELAELIGHHVQDDSGLTDMVLAGHDRWDETVVIDQDARYRRLT